VRPPIFYGWIIVAVAFPFGFDERPAARAA
jgi:hypothetical protein